MNTRFTDAQRAAINSSATDICVSAGAGSGKTGVLVQRFIRIVTESLSGSLPINQRAGVGEILVVTFTDRATKEMKTRIVEEFNALALIEQRGQLETAYISTIHGLCSRLLKEYPFEAGVDPGFTVLDEASSQRMLRDAFDEVMARAFREDDAEITDLISELINDPTFTGTDLDGPPMLAIETDAILSKLRGAGVTLDELQQIWRTGTSPRVGPDPVQTLLHPTFVELSACIDELRIMSARAGHTVRRAIGSVLDVVGKMRLEADTVTRVGNVQQLSAAAANVPSLLRTGQTDESLNLVLDRIKRASGKVSDLFGLSAEREALALLKRRQFAGLICKVWTSYTAVKKELGLLDNEDLMTKCVHLLEESVYVRRRCIRKFRHVMIDEFQDTDLLQMRLLQLLHESSATNSLRQPSTSKETEVSYNSGFIVGDVQQSIYGFRNADPDIFRGLIHRFREDGEAFYMQLSDNFRSRPEILQLVTKVFEIAWRAEPTPFEPLHSAGSFDSKPKPSIELLVSKNLARREYVHVEADTIARRIRTIVEDMNQHISITAHSSRHRGAPAGYGDIAVLLRGLADVHDYEEAFARHSVPALVTAGGRGYYARFEIQDLLAALTLLDSPLDDIALLTALRSPFVGADMNTLYRLGVIAGRRGPNSDRARRPLYPALRQLMARPDLPAAERDKIEPFLLALDRLRSDVDRIPVAQLIDRLIVRTNYDMRLVCRPNGRRKLANVRKLVQIALRDPGICVCDFISRMRNLELISDREGDAPTSEDGAGVVRIMTIHAAKGLEFPIVVLPDLSRGLVSPETSLFTVDPISRSIGVRIAGEPDAAYTAIVKRRQEADKREYLRLLYVAMTRSREHLILCGNVGRNRGFNWADVIFPALGITSAPAREERVLLNGGIEATVSPFSTLREAPDYANPGGADDLAVLARDQLVENLLRVTVADNTQA